MRLPFLMGLAALLSATIYVSVHPGASTVSLGSLRQMWSDTLRDADQPGMRLTRLSAGEEMRLGAQLTAAVPSINDRQSVERVARVSQRLIPHVRRREIVYRFRLLAAPQPNAFALPGGQVLVTSGMLELVQSDDELAEILGHEIAHVDLRHAVERYQYQYRLDQFRLGGLVELAHRLATVPFSADQELDADAEGLRLSVAAGYDPAAAPAVFTRLRLQHPDPDGRQADTPAGEIAQSLSGMVVSFFRTHPPSSERARRLSELAGRGREYPIPQRD